MKRAVSTLALVVVFAAAPQLLAQSDDSPQQANPIRCGQTLDQDIGPLGDVDYLTFELGIETTVRIDIDAAERGSGLDSVLGLFDGNLVNLATSDDSPAPGESFTYDSYIEAQLGAGPYYIAVSSYADFGFSGFDAFTTGPYSITLGCPPGSDVVSEVEIFSKAALTDSPAVAFNSKSKSFLVLGHTDGRLSCRQVGFDRESGPWLLRPEALSADETPTYAVSYSARNRTFLTLRARSDGVVLATRLDRRGEQIGQPVEIATASSPIEEVDVTSLTKRTSWLATWQEGADVDGVLIGRDGQVLGGVFNLARGVRRYAIGYAAKGQTFLLVWESDPAAERPGIYGQLFSRTGARIGSTMILAAGDASFRPAVDFNPKSKRWLVVWATEVGPGTGAIDGRMIRSRTPGPVFRIAASDSRLSGPAVAYSRPLKMILVSWADLGTRREAPQILGQWVGRRGNLAGLGFAISSSQVSKDTDNEEFAACSSRRPARCLVTWWEGEVGESASIRGRFLGPPGPPPPQAFMVTIELGQDDPFPDEVLDLLLNGQFVCQGPVGGGCQTRVELAAGSHTLAVRLVSDTGASGGSPAGTEYFLRLSVEGEASPSWSETRKTITGIGSVQETRFSIYPP